METQYQFGSMKIGGEEKPTLRTKSDAPFFLKTGVFLSVEKREQAMVVTHTFKVDRLLNTDSDADGNSYAWYVLSEHFKAIDRSPAAASEAAKNSALIDYLSMMVGINLPNTGQSGGESVNEQEL